MWLKGTWKALQTDSASLTSLRKTAYIDGRTQDQAPVTKGFEQRLQTLQTHTSPTVPHTLTSLTNVITIRHQKDYSFKMTEEKCVSLRKISNFPLNRVISLEGYRRESLLTAPHQPQRSGKMYTMPNWGLSYQNNPPMIYMTL